MPFTVGSNLSAKKRRPRAVFIVRLQLSDGKSVVTGRSGDRPSFGWLDKRTVRTPDQKLTDLIALVQKARDIYLDEGSKFSSAFQLWYDCHEKITAFAKETDHESLSASYASALFERAVIDAVCRAGQVSFFHAVGNEVLGIRPGLVHEELQDLDIATILPGRQRNRFAIRHTVGFADPLTDQDLEKRIGDGEPETLAEYIKTDGLRFFKVKISGNPVEDIARLEKIWQVVQKQARQPAITLDGNEAYKDIDEFDHFVSEMESQLTGLFQHTLFIEQPLTRALTHDPGTEATIRKISTRKPLVIDEADGFVDAFKQAFSIGYSGTSHKNCKGVFKSILNRALTFRFLETTGRESFLSGEDLSNMSIVPLHQDFDTLSVLDISHCERNGHHYAYGMSHLTEVEKSEIEKHHQDLYRKENNEWFLNIQDGEVECSSVFGPGFGGATMPDWESLTPLDEWKG